MGCESSKNTPLQSNIPRNIPPSATKASPAVDRKYNSLSNLWIYNLVHLNEIEDLRECDFSFSLIARLTVCPKLSFTNGMKRIADYFLVIFDL